MSRRFNAEMAIAVALLSAAVAPARAEPVKNIVIVHGAFADGSGWEAVYRILTKDGYNVSIVQNSTVSLAADVTATQNVLANQNGSVVLVGHSYGGEVITQAGDDPKVKSLVYVAAYAPDAGESLQSLTAHADPSAKAPPIFLPRMDFCCSIARNFLLYLRRTSTAAKRSSWPLRKFPLESKPLPIKSRRSLGKPSPAITSSPAMIS